MHLGPGFPIAEPAKLSKKDVSVDVIKLSKAITKSLVGLATGNWASAAKDGASILGAVGLKDSPGQAAWKLIQAALFNSFATLVQETKGTVFDFKMDEGALARDIYIELDRQEVIISKKFLNNPSTLPLLVKMQEFLFQRFVELGLEEASASAMVNRLPAYFIFALHHECREQPANYELIRTSAEAGFSEQAEYEADWLRYHAWLQKMVEDPMLAEAFSLQRVYVPLRAYYDDHGPQPREGIAKENTKKKIERHVVMLDDYLESWSKSPSRKDSILVMTGGPGSGKSSCAKIFAAKQAILNKRRVLYIPLHYLDPSKELISAINEYAEGHEFLPNEPLGIERKDKAPILLILDGLDELSMMGKQAERVAEDFVYDVVRHVERLNSASTRIIVLLCGRDLAVQAGSRRLRRQNCILNLIPYLVSNNKEQNQEVEVNDPAELLEIDQRGNWWKRYGVETGKDFETIPDVLQGKDLQPITAQPLLNYLVSLSLARGSIDFKKDTNLNDIYEDLINQVYERGYGDHRTPGAQLLKFHEFERAMEVVAISVWHGQSHTTTVNDIHCRCEKEGLTPLLEKLTQGDKPDVVGLLMAFFFRRHPDMPGEDAVEFTHKSFWEYLVAKAIMRAALGIKRQIERHKPGSLEGWDITQALVYWLNLTGPAELDEYIFEFLRREAQLLEEDAAPLQSVFVRLLNQVLEVKTPIHEMGADKPDSFEDMCKFDRNASAALLVVLSCCARVTDSVSDITLCQATAFGELLKNLQGQREDGRNRLVFSCLNHLDIEGVCLNVVDLYSANLANCNLKHAGLILSILQHANLNESNLSKANLGSCNLNYARLYGAKLKNASLSRANLKRAYLSKSDLQFAYLEGANLELTDLDRANLQGAKLMGANLSHAEMNNANLNATDLRMANLKNASLIGASLVEAVLLEANLRGANLDEANLEEANLVRANLQGATLRGTNLKGANLQGAKLRGADFDNANLEGANLKATILHNKPH